MARPRKVLVGIDECSFSRAMRLIQRVLDCGDDVLDLLPEWNVMDREQLEHRLDALRRFTAENHKIWEMDGKR